MILLGTCRDVYRWDKCVCTVSIVKVSSYPYFFNGVLFEIDTCLLSVFVRIYLKKYEDVYIYIYIHVYTYLKFFENLIPMLS